jgi:integrase
VLPSPTPRERTVALDADTTADIARWRREQDREREAAAGAWQDSGFEFTDERGRPLNPGRVTDTFHMIAYLAGLPPIRLHDLRHGAATLLLAAGHDMKVVQETLGLSSITIAADTYTSVLPQLARKSAEDVAALSAPPQSRPRSTGPTAPPSPRTASRASPARTAARQEGGRHDQRQRQTAIPDPFT